MTKRTLFGINVRCQGRSLLALTPFFLGIGIALMHPSWLNPAIAQKDVVRLDVAVIDKAGRSIADLTQEEFTIFEDGVKQQIDSFNNQESPVSLGIVIDASGSARQNLKAIREIAFTIIRQMKPDDEAFIMQFRILSSLVHGFTSHRPDLEKALDLIYTGGGTAIFTAITAASEYSRQHGRSGRRAVLILSDGQEKGSTISEDQLLKRLIEDNTQVHFLRMPAMSNMEPTDITGEVSNLITRLIQVTGGQIFPTSTKQGALDHSARFIENLRRQYELFYIRTNNKQDDKLRKIKVVVTLKDGRQINATTRQSYYGPGHKIQR